MPAATAAQLTRSPVCQGLITGTIFLFVACASLGVVFVLGDRAVRGTLDGYDSQLELNLIVPSEGLAMRRALQAGCMIALMGSWSVGFLSFRMQRLRRASARMIEESRERYRTMADSVPVMVWSADAGGRLTDFNQRWLNFTGRTLEQECVRGWGENIHPEDREEMLCAFESACAKGEVFSHEYRLRRADGVYRWVRDLGHPRRDAEEKVIGYVGGALDISDRKHAEMTLALSEHRMRTIIDTALDAVITIELSISPVTGVGEVSFSAFLRDITKRKQAEVAARRSRADADVRLSVSMIIQDSKPIDDRVRRALAAMSTMPGMNEAHRLLLCDVRGSFGEQPAGYGWNDAEVTDSQRVLCEEALGSGEIRTLSTSECGWIAVPMRHSGQSIGVLLLAAGREPELDVHRIETLDRIAEMLAMAVLRERSERALGVERDRSEAAARSKSAFLANMSHEIRTPMTAILGFADMLAEESGGEGPVDPQQRRELVETIKRNGRHLLCIINDILDVSKIEAGKMRVDLLPTDPSAVVREIIDLFRGTEQARLIDLNCRMDPQLPAWILTDAVRLRQILVNLVGNALKFTEIGSVTIDVGWDPSGRLSVAVSDTGPGMSAAQLNRLFRPFTQGDETTTRQFGGTGLGLVIARRLARMLGGDIVVQSTPGEGSIFTVTITADEVVPVCDAKPPHARPASSVDAQRPLSGYRVLVVEDGPDNQRLIRFLLERAGAEVVIKCNGQQAIDEITTQVPDIPYDLILMDMQMPVMDGYTATRELRSFGCAVPIVAITAHAMNGDRARCEAAGCCDYITKPVDRDAFLKICLRWLGTARVR